MKYSVVYLGVFLWVAASVPSRAATMTFTNEDDFLAAAGETGLESFESLGATSPGSNPVVTDSFVANIKPITASKANMQIKSSPQTGTHATDGSNFLLAGGGPSAFDFELEFSFDEPLTSFGFNLNDFGEARTPGALIFTTDTSETFSITEVPEYTEDGNELFFGIVTSQPFLSVTLSKTNVDDGIGIDEIYFTLVPEPTAVALLLVGACGLLLRYRKRR